jgi:DNA repair protein RadC
MDFHHASNIGLLANLAGAEVAETLLKKFGNLTNLAKTSMAELQQVRGVGQARAAAIQSAFLLASRLSKEAYPPATLLDTPEAVAALLREDNRLYTVETFQVILVNTRRRLIGVELLSQGTLDTLLVHPREVFSVAVQRRAAAIVLAHNHPSGDPMPSEADIKVTRDLIRAGQLLKIEILDHVIMGQATKERARDWVSLRELGYFYT